jgi:hypothetical protein
MWHRDGEYYRRLLDCHRTFAQPYLALGRMLRMPRLTGEPFARRAGTPDDTRPAVEGSAWQAPDGTVGIFFLNYSDLAQPFTWTFDLAEHAGITAAETVRLLSWSEDAGLTRVADLPGGVLSRNEKIEARGIMALKVEVTK